MSALPRISGRDAVKALRKLDYVEDRQTGSHIILRQTSEPFRRLTIPNHNELAKETLRAIIRQTGLTVDEFKQLL